MEIVLSAVLSELTTRSINFFINKISKPTSVDVEDRLRRILHRAQVIIDEAMGQHITNQAMLQQLDMIRDAMYGGYYMLDVLRCQSLDKGNTRDQVMSHSLSKLNFWSSSRNTQISEQLEKAHDDLSSMIIDMKESLVLLTSYPVLYRQPYSIHLLLENCMFGRQSEAELVIKFLLKTHPHRAKELEVLPIVGPSKVDKSTLVAHICKDERVRDHFSEVVFLHDHDFTDDELATFTEGSARKQQNRLPESNKEGRRLLVVVELAGNLNEDAWNRLYSACIPSNSKIIITSQSDKTVKFGTTRALTLKHLSREAYWYFFKTLTFGSTNPEMHLRFAYLAMEIARLLDGTLLRANMAAKLLGDNFDIGFWCNVLAFLRITVENHVARFGEHPFTVVDQNRPIRFRRTGAPSKDFVIYHQYQQRSSGEEVPNVGIQDVIFGSFKPHDVGKMDMQRAFS
ncbi:hypothetical protein PR202_ga28563 [Eleusine coracana subsp. coracana]|uniref:Rx N-terminal domain-containing protein n=1 Tax=Eleusine coracana subsp. coracana TaxID=191504 RepID=A0AAV5DHN9_ELECO|nr:hypothetical protein PR202_ga28563 [Eleusine coracana subsp. coracana]